MNNISEIRFEQGSIKISKDDCGVIEKICINDICGALNRKIFLKDGTAIRKCPSAMMLDQSHPQEFYADFDEMIEFIKWMCKQSKILALSGQQLLVFIQESRIIPVETQQSIPEVPLQEDDTVELEYAGHKFSMKTCDGRYMVNATEMSRPFDKRPNVWLKTTEAAKLRQALVDDGISKSLESQVLATRGAYGSTWLEVHLWVHFAQWLSPAFASWCSKKIVPLMRNGYVNMNYEPESNTPSRARQATRYDDLEFTTDSLLPIPENYETALAVIEGQKATIHKQREFIQQNKHKFEHYVETIEIREWFSTTMIANELGLSAIQLNLFLMDEEIQKKVDGQWTVLREYGHLRDYHFYEWYNHKTKYTNKYKIDSWTPEGREYIIELWKKVNG